VSLVPGITILALAVLLGGLAALWRDQSRRVLRGLRTFAVVAAVSIALVHLLPEAIADAGWWALLAAIIGLVAPALLERILPGGRGHTEQAPSTALAMGYAAVLAHQLGEGAAVASLARANELSPAIVLAIAAHTTPLAMVVAIRVLEVKEGQDGGSRAMALALAGVALATGVGALLGTSVSASQLDAVRPWILAGISGLLLHALAHNASAPPAPSVRGRVGDALAGLAGLGLAMTGVEQDSWVQKLDGTMRTVATLVLAAVVVAWSLLRRSPEQAGHRPVRSGAIRTATEPPPRSAAPDPPEQ
jgi:ZIP family zinc transporter